jgi:hypothetical protein
MKMHWAPSLGLNIDENENEDEVTSQYNVKKTSCSTLAQVTSYYHAKFNTLPTVHEFAYLNYKPPLWHSSLSLWVRASKLLTLVFQQTNVVGEHTF